MSQFAEIRFHGSFRDYQSRVLKNAESYLADGKIHIVAAPGSGKTVLGLELIRMIGKPALIFSPTTAIREQWGERFRDLFLEDRAAFSSLFSTSLADMRLLNSVTYQALFTAMEKTTVTEGDDDSFPDVDILREIRERGIGTICLDEAHHLKNEWQRALEKLIALVGEEVKIIALTATPPYDAEGNEWSRYLAMCGEVDEEIFVPELVAQDTLCSHQDYIYFNYPTDEELSLLDAYRARAVEAVEMAGKCPALYALFRRVNAERDYDILFSSAKEYIALLVLFAHYGWAPDPRLIRTLVGRRGLPPYEIGFAETALHFLLEGELLTAPEKEALIAVFKRMGVYEKKKLSLAVNERLKRTLLASVGKLESIAAIAKSEHEAMGKSLRMLVLTDYIKKEDVTRIASAERFSSISIVSIFETLRRADAAIPLGVLSGSLVILPNDVALSDIPHTRTPIAGTAYSVITPSGSLHAAVRAVGALFARGEIEILIGTKSLLGEGWDAPVINSLIMASFVGSYVLSNQMRGRAIRIDKNDPGKTANIWHLVTVEPPHLVAESKLAQAKEYLKWDKNELISCDYDILKRRFDSFMGPHYDTGCIESGIERITAVRPPYDKAGIAAINRNMLTRAADRAAMRAGWDHEVKAGSFSVTVESRVPGEKYVPVFSLFNILTLIALAAAEGSFVAVFFQAVEMMPLFPFPIAILFAIASGLIAYAGYLLAKQLILHGTPARSVKTLGTAVYRTLVATGQINSAARVESQSTEYFGTVMLWLRNASVHDQNLFNTAMAEMLSPIENPRYILIKKRRFGGYDYSSSFACPAVIGKKKETVEVLAGHLAANTGDFVPVYTRTENGRALILKCRKRAFITKNREMLYSRGFEKKYTVRRWE